MAYDLTYPSPIQQQKDNISRYEQKLEQEYKQLDNWDSRPSTHDYLYNYYDQLISEYASNPNLMDAYFLSIYSDTLITVFDILNKKIFKGGLQIKPIVKNPDEQQRLVCEAYINNATVNGESLVDVFKEVETNANWSNLRAFLITKNYKIVGNKLISLGVREIISVDPLTLQAMKSKSGKLGYFPKSNQAIFFSPKNRRQTLTEPTTNGVPNLRADYRINSSEGAIYYDRSELIVRKKFPSNPLFALKNKILSLIEQDKYIQKEYSEGKPSKKLILVKGPNRSELRESFQEYQESLRSNPNKAAFVMVGGMDKEQNIIEAVDLARSLDEMEATQYRNEVRNAVGAVYGVSPIFQNDQSKAGGLNYEGLQLTVTNETIDANKDSYDGFLRLIFNDTMGITDYEVCTYPNEEEDDMSIEELFAKKLANAKTVLDLGGKVKFNAEDKEFIFEDSELIKPEPINPFNNNSELPDNSNNKEKDTQDLVKASVAREDKLILPNKSAVEMVTEQYSKEFEKKVRELLDLL